MDISLKDLKIVISAGGSGIGKAILRGFHAQGAKIATCDINSDLIKILQDEYPDIYTEVLDVSDEHKVQSFCSNALNKLGGLDCLVNNAGIAGPSYKTWEYPNEDWEDVINVDLNGTFNCCKAVVPHMINKNYGRIVNIASIAGKEGNPNASAYSAAKAGVIALTKSLGKELAEFNIAINCVTPAAAKTKIFDQISQEHIDYMLSKIPRNRFVKVDELASMVAWMVSAENSFTTGAVFDISGGRATY